MRYSIPLPALLIAFCVFANLLVSGCSQPANTQAPAGGAQSHDDGDHAHGDHDHGDHDHGEHAGHDHDEGHDGETAAAHDHSGWWCAEHGVPEEVCTRCDVSLIADFKDKGDWCDEHTRPDSQCFHCHPELEAQFAARYEAKFGKKPPKPTEL